MRTVHYSPQLLRELLLRQKIATLHELKAALKTSTELTVFRKLRELSYRTSYSHRGGYYTLNELISFDENGLWAWNEVRFSRFGTLVDTAEALVSSSPRGYFASELAAIVQVPVKDTLLSLVRQHRLDRQESQGIFLYLSIHVDLQRTQLNSRRAMVTPQFPSVRTPQPEALSDEIITRSRLLFSILDEKQQRLLAGLESLKLGYGGDVRIARLLQIDPHTVARGRKELLSNELGSDRIRRAGAGRKRVEKKAPKS